MNAVIIYLLTLFEKKRVNRYVVRIRSKRTVVLSRVSVK